MDNKESDTIKLDTKELDAKELDAKELDAKELDTEDIDDKVTDSHAGEISGLRNHFTYVFEEAWKTIVAFAAFFLLSDISADIIKELQLGNWIIVMVILAGVAVVFLLIILFFVNRWRKTYISVKDGMLTVERKLLMHYRNEIALENISNINLEQNLFEMVVGTYKLKLDTNSSSTADKTDVKIVLKADVAYNVKNAIMEMMKKVGQDEHDAVTANDMTAVTAEYEGNMVSEPDIMDDIAENDYDIIYDNKSIIKNCIAKTSVFVIMVIIGLFIGLGFQISEMIKDGKTIASAIVTFFATIVLNMSVLKALISSWFNDFRFRVKRHKDKIYVSCGLLKKKKYAIPVEMVNAVRIYTSFIGRFMKLYCVDIVSVGGEEAEAQGKTILLAGKIEDLKEKLAVILPEYELPDIKNTKRMSVKVLCARLILSAMFISAVVAILCALPETFMNIAADEGAVFSDEDKSVYNMACLAGGAGALLLWWIIGIVTYMQRRLYIGENDLVTVEGCFGKKIMTISYKKIQYVNYSQGIVSRFIKVYSGTIHILATMALSTYSLGKYDMETYDKLNEKMRDTY